MKTLLAPFLLVLCYTAPLSAQWQVIHPGFPDSLDLIAWGLDVVDENVIWVDLKVNIAAPSPYFCKTADGGQTWKLGKIEGGPAGWWANWDLDALDANTAWIVRARFPTVDTTILLKTTDGGDNWTYQNLPFTGALMGIHFFNENEGAAWGEIADNGTIDTYPIGYHIECFYTQDGGNNWLPAAYPLIINEGFITPVNADGTYEVLGNAIWAGTAGGRVFRSRDKGKTWTVSAARLDRMVSQLAFRDSLTGLAVSFLDTVFNNTVGIMVYHTADGGDTWTPVSPANAAWSGYLLFDVEYVPGSGGAYWGVITTQTVLSTDNGNTWVKNPPPELLWYTEFLSPNTGWGAGATHPTPSTSNVVLYKWAGDSIMRKENQNHTRTAAGSGIEGRLDGPAANARFYNPKGMAIDRDGNVYVADDYNHGIRKIALDGQVSTLAGTGQPGYADGPGASAQFNRPSDVVLDAAGNLYVADAENYVVRKITPDGAVSLWAGIPGVSGEINGAALQATFSRPVTLGIDPQGNLYVGGSPAIRKISPEGQVGTVHIGTGNILCLDVDRYGNIYFADNGTPGVYKRTPDGQVALLAGSGSGCADGQGAAAQFGSLDDLDADDVGNVYVADGRNARIRKIDPAGNVVTLVGSDCMNGYGLDQQPVDGPGAMDRPGWVRDILLKPGESLLTTSWDNDMVREIRLGSLPRVNGVVTKAGSSPHYRSVPVSLALPLAFSGTVANTGPTSLAGVRMSAAVTNGVAQIWSKTTLPQTIAPGGQADLAIGENLTLTTSGVYQVQLKFYTVSAPSNPFGIYAEEIVVSDSVLSADDGHVFFYDNINAVAPGGKASYGQVYTIPATDTLTGFSVNAELQQTSFYFSVFAMNDSVPGGQIYASDTLHGISNDFPHDYYHRLPKSLILPPGKYLFALEQWSVTGSLGMGVDTDRNDQSAWYRSADDGVEQWTPAYTFWGEPTAPVYMLRPVFGAPVKTVSDTEEASSKAPLQIQIVPNPVADRLYVKVNAALSEIFNLQLTDVSGKTVIETTIPGGTVTAVDVNGLPAGMYWVRVMDGERVGVGKVVKQ